MMAWDEVEGPNSQHPQGAIVNEEREYLSSMLDKLQSRVDMADERRHNTGEAMRIPYDTMNNPHAYGPEADIVEIKKELKEKSAKVTLLHQKFEKLSVAFRAEKEIQRRALSQADEYKERLKKSQAEARQLQRTVQSLELNGDQLESLQIIADDLRGENKALQERISQLTQNVFEGDQLEAQRLRKVVQDFTVQVHNLKTKLADKEQEVLDAYSDCRKLNDANAKLSKSLETVRDEKQALDRRITLLNQRVDELTHKLESFSNASGVDLEDLERALDLIRREREDPSAVTFMDGVRQEDGLSVNQMKRRMQEMEIKNKELILEIQQKSEMLESQAEINRLQRKQFSSAHEKVAGLTQALEYSKRHGDRADAMSDMSMFSNAESSFSELSTLDNIVAVRVTEARLNPDFALFARDSDEAPPVTFVTCDFFEFETSASGLFGGYKPKYNFTSQYRVTTDSFFVQHLEKESLYLEMYKQVEGTEVVKLGYCFIPLRNLLSAYPVSKVSGTAKIVSGDVPSFYDPQDRQEKPQIVAEIRFVLRMLRPIVSPPNSARGGKNSPRAALRKQQAEIERRIADEVHQQAAGNIELDPVKDRSSRRGHHYDDRDQDHRPLRRDEREEDRGRDGDYRDKFPSPRSDREQRRPGDRPRSLSPRSRAKRATERRYDTFDASDSGDISPPARSGTRSIHSSRRKAGGASPPRRGGSRRSGNHSDEDDFEVHDEYGVRASAAPRSRSPSHRSAAARGVSSARDRFKRAAYEDERGGSHRPGSSHSMRSGRSGRETRLTLSVEAIFTVMRCTVVELDDVELVTPPHRDNAYDFLTTRLPTSSRSRPKFRLTFDTTEPSIAPHDEVRLILGSDYDRDRDSPRGIIRGEDGGSIKVAGVMHFSLREVSSRDEGRDNIVLAVMDESGRKKLGRVEMTVDWTVVEVERSVPRRREDENDHFGRAISHRSGTSSSRYSRREDAAAVKIQTAWRKKRGKLLRKGRTGRARSPAKRSLTSSGKATSSRYDSYGYGSSKKKLSREEDIAAAKIQRAWRRKGLKSGKNGKTTSGSVRRKVSKSPRGGRKLNSSSFSSRGRASEEEDRAARKIQGAFRRKFGKGRSSVGTRNRPASRKLGVPSPRGSNNNDGTLSRGSSARVEAARRSRSPSPRPSSLRGRSKYTPSEPYTREHEVAAKRIQNVWKKKKKGNLRRPVARSTNKSLSRNPSSTRSYDYEDDFEF